MAAVSVIPCVLDFFHDEIVRQEILPKTRKVYEQNGGDVKIVLAVFSIKSFSLVRFFFSTKILLPTRR